MRDQASFEFPALSDRARTRMLRHALDVITAQRLMTRDDGTSILHHTLNGAERHVKMAHYPKGDRIDPVTGAQYYYHAHRENLATEEHGHFHCFLGCRVLPHRMKSLQEPPLAHSGATGLTHLIGIALNRHSRPVRLFTVNRWVTADTWFDARRMPAVLKRFDFRVPVDSPWNALDRWIAGMVQLFAPQIVWLTEARDRAIAARREMHPDVDPCQKHELEELSDLPINLDHQIECITARDTRRKTASVYKIAGYRTE